MAIDISKVFKANVKAIRMSLSDGSNNADILNEQLLKAGKNSNKTTTTKHPNDTISKQAKNIVIFFFQ
jgi:hypothetical protein